MWQQYRSGGWRGWLLPIALVITAAAQIYMLMSYLSWSQWLSPLIGVLTVLVVITLIFLRLRPRLSLSKTAFRVARVAISAGLLTLLWLQRSGLATLSSIIPSLLSLHLALMPRAILGACPMQEVVSQGAIGMEGIALEDKLALLVLPEVLLALPEPLGNGSCQTDSALISYLESHQGNAKFLVATTSSSNTADSIILSYEQTRDGYGWFYGRGPYSDYE